MTRSQWVAFLPGKQVGNSLRGRLRSTSGSAGKAQAFEARFSRAADIRVVPRAREVGQVQPQSHNRSEASVGGKLMGVRHGLLGLGFLQLLAALVQGEG